MGDDLKQGNLEGRIFPYILRDIYYNKLSGMLSINRSHIRKFLFFSTGKATFAQSSLPDEQLTMLMLRGAVISDIQYSQLCDLIREGGWRNPKIEEMGIVPAKTIDWWLKTLIREIVLSIFDWEEGSFRFLYDKNPPATCPVVQIDTLNLLFACIRRTKDPHILVGWLKSLDAVPKVNYSLLTEKSGKLSLTPQEGFFISRIDSVMTFRQILSMAGAQRLEMLQFFVAANLAKLIEIGPVKEIIKPAQFKVAQDPIQPRPFIMRDKNFNSTQVRNEKPKQEFEKPSSEPTDDITLTPEELKELNDLGGNFKNLERDLKYSGDAKEADSEVGLDSKISYLRGDEFVDANTQDGAMNIDEMKLKTTDSSNLSDDGKISFLINGQEVDAEDNLFGTVTASDVFASDDVETQWNRWMEVEAEEQDEDVYEEWEKSWRAWEDQHREMQLLQDKRKHLETEISSCKNSAELSVLQKKVSEADRYMMRLVDSKKREILGALRRSKIQNHYEVLKLKSTASLDEIRAAYFYWLNEYQPDRRNLEHYETVKEHLNKLVERLHQAYEVLSDDYERAKYDEELQKQVELSLRLSGKKQTLAQDHFGSGKQALERGDPMLAMRYLRGSMSLDPRNPVYYEEMAKILAQTRNYYDEALRYYHKAFHLDRSNTDILVEVAKLSIKMDRPEFAAKVLQQVLNQQPTHGAAKKLLELIRRNK